MSSNPVLFFDVDGPMVPSRAWFMPANIIPRYGWTFDPCAVGYINFLGWLEPELRIVIGSHRNGIINPFDNTWTCTKVSWERVLAGNGIDVKLHEDWSTPRDPDGAVEAKIVEISRWLARHPEVDRFITFEDEAPGYCETATPAQRKYLHLCGEDSNNGLTWQDMEAAVKWLGHTTPLSKLVEKYRAEKAKQYQTPRTLRGVLKRA